MSLLKSGEQCYIKATNNKGNMENGSRHCLFECRSHSGGDSGQRRVENSAIYKSDQQGNIKLALPILMQELFLG